MNKYRILALNAGVAQEIEIVAVDIVQAIYNSGIIQTNIIKVQLIGVA